MVHNWGRSGWIHTRFKGTCSARRHPGCLSWLLSLWHQTAMPCVNPTRPHPVHVIKLSTNLIQLQIDILRTSYVRIQSSKCKVAVFTYQRLPFKKKKKICQKIIFSVHYQKGNKEFQCGTYTKFWFCNSFTWSSGTSQSFLINTHRWKKSENQELIRSTPELRMNYQLTLMIESLKTLWPLNPILWVEDANDVISLSFSALCALS